MRYSFIILLIVLSSCSLEKRLAKYCPICPNEIETVVEYRDTTITVELPGDTITMTDSLYCDSLGNVYSIKLYEQEKENMRLRSKLKNNKYTVTCESDTVYVDKIVEGNTVRVTETKKIDIPFIPWWAKMLMFWGGASILSFIIVLLFKRYKR